MSRWQLAARISLRSRPPTFCEIVVRRTWVFGAFLGAVGIFAKRGRQGPRKNIRNKGIGRRRGEFGD